MFDPFSEVGVSKRAAAHQTLECRIRRRIAFSPPAPDTTSHAMEADERRPSP